MDYCLENAFSRDWLEHVVVTTKPQSAVSREKLCQAGQIGSLASGTITIIPDDEEARFYIGYKDCYTNQIKANTVHISEAKSHNENFNRFVTIEDQNTGGLPHGLGAVIGTVGGGALMLMVLLFVFWRAGFKCCGQRKNEAGSGNYGRASIDSNFQYGEGQEYYHYQKDKNQTRVVDENEMYANYDHE